MKKVILITSLFVLTQTAVAQFSINFGVGKDFYTIEAIENKEFSLWDGTPALVERDEISNPFYANLQLEYQSGSLIYGLALAGAYQKYHMKYYYSELRVPPHPTDNKTEEDVIWARIEINPVLLYEIELNKSLAFDFGIGGGLQIMAPVVSDKFIYETTLNKALDLDFTDEVELAYLFNGKAIARAKFKITSNFSLGAEANYLMVQKGDYEQPSNFFTAFVFLGITF